MNSLHYNSLVVAILAHSVSSVFSQPDRQTNLTNQRGPKFGSRGQQVSSSIPHGRKGGFSDTNMVGFQTQNCRVGGLSQREDTTQVVSRCSGI